MIHKDKPISVSIILFLVICFSGPAVTGKDAAMADNPAGEISASPETYSVMAQADQQSGNADTGTSGDADVPAGETADTVQPGGDVPDATDRAIEDSADEKGTSDTGEKDTVTPEKKEAEPAPKKEKKATPLFDPHSTRYVGIVAGYGGFFPVADYGQNYLPAHLVEASVPVYYLTLWHFHPEFNFRYAKLKSDHGTLEYESTITLMEFFPSIVFSWEFSLPKKELGPVRLYARIYDGVTRLEYVSLNPLFPYLGKVATVELINVFGFSVGCDYFIFKGFFVGIDAGYSIVATAGTPLQSMSLTIHAGYRIF